MQKTVCELFAGVGGFRLGLQHASPQWETVWFPNGSLAGKNNGHMTVM